MKKGRIQRWFWLYRSVAKISPGLFAAEYGASAVYGVSLALLPFALEWIFTSMEGFASHAISFPQMLLPILALWGVHLISEITAGMSDYLGETYADLAAQKLSASIHQKIASLPAIDFEDPATLNLIDKARWGAYSIRGLVHVTMDLLTMYLPYFLIYSWYLYQRNPILLVLLVLIFFPVLIAQVVKERFFSQQEEEAAPIRRKKEAFAQYISTKELAKEARTLGAVPDFFQRYCRAQKEMNKSVFRREKKNCTADILAAVVNIVGYLGILLFLIVLVLDEQIPVSAFVAVFASIRTVYEQMEEILGGRLQEMSGAVSKVKNYFRFLDLPSREQGNGQMPIIHHLELQNVGFQYPNGAAALSNIHLQVQQGELTAIVGENGSGKTTLSKILSGIYPMSSGSLKINGQKMGSQVLLSASSQLFQSYNQYHMSMGTNIAIGNAPAISEEDALRAIQTAGFQMDANRFPKGLHTMLGRTFGGVELSGGEWQRIALARAIYRPCQILILDEPTASIDPAKETELYESFRLACKDKIGFLITHRLGVVKLCQKVIVMQKGRILDTGTHEELLGRCAYYRSLWNAQANPYAE